MSAGCVQRRLAVSVCGRGRRSGAQKQLGDVRRATPTRRKQRRVTRALVGRVQTGTSRERSSSRVHVSRNTSCVQTPWSHSASTKALHRLSRVYSVNRG